MVVRSEARRKARKERKDRKEKPADDIEEEAEEEYATKKEMKEECATKAEMEKAVEKAVEKALQKAAKENEKVVERAVETVVAEKLAWARQAAADAEAAAEKRAAEDRHSTHAKGVLEARVASLEVSMREKACSRQLQALDFALIHNCSYALEQIHNCSDSVETMQSQLRALHEAGIVHQHAGLVQSVRANNERMHQMEDVIDGIRLFEKALETRVAGIDNALAKKVGIDDFRSLRKSFEAEVADIGRDLETCVEGIDRRLTQKVSIEEFHTFETCIEGIDRRLSQKVSIDDFQSHVARIEAEVATIRNNLLDVSDMSHTRESAIESVTDRLAEVLISLKGKVDSSDVEQMCGSLSALQTQVSDVGAALKEKVCLTQLNSTTMAWQIQMTQIENSLQQKVDVDRMQQLSSIFSGFDLKLNTLVNDLQSGANQMQLLDGHVAAFRKQLLEMKEASASATDVVNTSLEGLSKEVKAKPSIDQLHHVQKDVSQVQAKINNLDATLQVGASKFPQIEQSMASDRRALQQLESSLASLETGVANLQQQAKEGTGRLKHLESSIANVGDDFTGFQQGLDEAFANLDQHDARPQFERKPPNPSVARRHAPY